MSRIRLFCLPYAGGSSLIYKDWGAYLDRSIECKAIELAGRGKRILDPAYADMEELLDDVFRIIGDDLYGGPYALFGHSMGAFISYELAVRIRARGMPAPVHVFFSGRHAPQIHGERKKYHLMNDHEFRKEVLKLGGAPSELFDNEELATLFLPLLKNDFRLAESYRGPTSVEPFDFDISVLLGKGEELSNEEIVAWKDITDGACSILFFPGDHFFINKFQRSIINWINFKLLTVQKWSLKI